MHPNWVYTAIVEVPVSAASRRVDNAPGPSSPSSRAAASSRARRTSAGLVGMLAMLP